MSGGVNIHATCLVIGERGMLIRGESGSGKSSLAQHLLWMAGQAGFARLLSDDRVVVEARHGRVVASAPATIEGLVEVWGHGLVRAPTVGAAVIDLIVRLEPHGDLERLPAARRERLDGVDLPLFEAPAREIAVAARLVLAALATLR